MAVVASTESEAGAAQFTSVHTMASRSKKRETRQPSSPLRQHVESKGSREGAIRTVCTGVCIEFSLSFAEKWLDPALSRNEGAQ